MELLHDLIRARALEHVLGRVRTGDPSPSRPVSPATPAARALHRATDGSGDLFSLRRGSAAAALCLGLAPVDLLRQAAARASAPAAGRDPGGVPTDLARGLLAPVEMPGVLLQVMAGAAMSFRLRGESRVALLVDGLPAGDAGDWHEGLSVATARQAPLVVVVHGPRSAADDRRGAGPTREPGAPPAPMPVPVKERAPGYGFRAWWVDGQDPRAVEKVTWQAVEAARSSGGPQVVEVARPARDPVDWLAETLVTAGTVEAGEVQDLLEQARSEMEETWDRVRDEPVPAPDQVSAGDPGVLRRSWCRWEGAA